MGEGKEDGIRGDSKHFPHEKKNIFKRVYFQKMKLCSMLIMKRVLKNRQENKF